MFATTGTAVVFFPKAVYHLYFSYQFIHPIWMLYLWYHHHQYHSPHIFFHWIPLHYILHMTPSPSIYQMNFITFSYKSHSKLLFFDWSSDPPHVSFKKPWFGMSPTVPSYIFNTCWLSPLISLVTSICVT